MAPLCALLCRKAFGSPVGLAVRAAAIGGSGDAVRGRAAGLSEPCRGEAPFLGVGAGRGHRKANAAHADGDQRADLESLSRIVPQVASANWVWASPMRQGAEEEIGHRGEPQSVGEHGRRRSSVGEQVALGDADRPQAC